MSQFEGHRYRIITVKYLETSGCAHYWAFWLTTVEVRVLQALPQWSQQALQQHADDARDVKALEELENGQTGDAIWDAMQHQLKTYGAAPRLLWAS